jgi:hypothetical protein
VSADTTGQWSTSSRAADSARRPARGRHAE